MHDNSDDVLSLDFVDAVKSLERTIHLITYRFSLRDKYRSQLFDVAANMNALAWDILKWKFALKIVGKSSHERNFLMIFGGSSVTAGHDNYFHESYPEVFERRMKYAFDALKLKLIVRNIAQGSNDCYPYNLCYEAMGGDEPDWIGWEQSYNCGRDNGVFELIARVAAWNKAIIYYSASGGFIPDTCLPSTDSIPYISEKWVPELVGIKGIGNVTLDQIRAKRDDLAEWYDDGNSIAKFVGALNKDEKSREVYSGVGAHGFNWFGASKRKCYDDEKNITGCSAIDVRGRCQSEGGPNWMTLEAAKYTATSHGKKWHPSAGMHLMRGEIIAYRYAYILLDAIYMVQRDMKQYGVDELRSNYRAKLQLLQPDIGFLSPSYCDDICKFPPICYTDFEPNYNEEKKLNHILLESSCDTSDCKRWNRIQVKKDVPGLGNSQYGWLDRRPIYESSGVNSTISFSLEVRNHSIAILCGYPIKESLKYASFYLDQNISLTKGEAYLPSNSMLKWNDRVYFNSECTKLMNLPKGRHVLTIKSDSQSRKSSLSHVISF